jgi:iron complex transport system ATP-binding protein
MERVILLGEGRVLRDGPKRDVLTSEALSQLYRLPVEVLERGEYFHAV